MGELHFDGYLSRCHRSILLVLLKHREIHREAAQCRDCQVELVPNLTLTAVAAVEQVHRVRDVGLNPFGILHRSGVLLCSKHRQWPSVTSTRCRSEEHTSELQSHS